MRQALATTIAVGLTGSALFATGCRPSKPAGAREQVRFGLSAEIPNALPIIAIQQGFFAAEGLDLTVTEYVSGARALSELFTGAVEVATVAEVPIVAASFQRQDFRLFASIAVAGDAHSIVARRDAGIRQPAELRGKRIATQRASSVHFFLHLFLVNHGLADKDVTLSFLNAEELVPALMAGRIDAFSMREPFVSAALAQLGTNAVVFQPPGLYVRTQHLVGSAAFLRDRPETARRLVRGLLVAERFARHHPLEARQMMARQLAIAPDHLVGQWAQLNLKVSLDQSLLSQLEDEAIWLRDSHLVPPAPLPNYLRLLEPSVLGAVKPEAVTLLP